MNLRSPRRWQLLVALGVGVILCGYGVAGEELEKEDSIIQSALQRGNDGNLWNYMKSSYWSLWGETDDGCGCEETYGFMPCSTKLGGNAALLIMYSYAFVKAAQFLTEGSELLLTVMSPGVIGGLVLPILGAFPDALLITASGLGAASQAEAQEQVLVGMGLVAGSTVMVLTALWGSCLIVGRCDLVRSQSGKLVAKDRTLSEGFHLTGAGVTTDVQTRWASWIMMATLSPYIVAQIPRIFGLTTAGNLCIAIAAFISIASLIAYCVYQLVAAPWIQERQIYWALHRYRRTHALQRISLLTKEKNWGEFHDADGKPNEAVLQRLFDHFDLNKDGTITEVELRSMVIGLGIQRHNGQVPDTEEIEHWMTEFDISKDREISKEEFFFGIRKWIQSAKSFKSKSGSSSGSTALRTTSDEESKSGSYSGNPLMQDIFDDEAQTAKWDLASIMDDTIAEDEAEDKEREVNRTKAEIIGDAIRFLIVGAAIAAFFADPLVGAITGFSQSSGISPFFISFIATPLATSSSEAISSIMFARRKRKRNISMSYSQIYGAVTMKNTLCLGIFLTIVYFRGLVWDFSAEVLVILFATLIMGGVAAVRTTFPLWMAFIGLALYPASIGLVAFLDYVCGWH